MSWVTINMDKCTNCGLCVKRCALCFRKVGDEILVDANAETCNICGHCIALCPADALVHEKMNMDNFVAIDPDLNIDKDTFVDFVRARRSHRAFHERRIPREDLEMLIDLCRYCPTGSNRQTLEIIVIENEEKMARLSNLTVDYFEQAIDKIENAVKEYVDQGKDIPEDLEYHHARLGFLRMLVMARGMGWDVILHKAPAVMVFHSPVLTSTPKDDCVIAAHTVALTARTMGLETCYIGLLAGASKTYQPIREELALPNGHEVGSVLVLGYPTMKFLRTVDRFPMRVRWE